jgi:hypothetical protein
MYPITNDADIEAAIAALQPDKAEVALPGVTITPRDRFPNEFLPIEDPPDLLRKVYMAIIIDHEVRANQNRRDFVTSWHQFQASHPFSAEVE